MDIDIDNLIKNPSKGETHDDLEATIADQMARFTRAMSGKSTAADQREAFLTVTALGFDLMKICGTRVCEDTSQIFTNIVRDINPEMAYQFQQISNGCNNNDVCTYLYMCLPTLANTETETIERLCAETIGKLKRAHDRAMYRNFDSLDTERIAQIYKGITQIYKGNI